MQQEFTPENIQELKENEVFVFGSNLAGNHAGGAAAFAHRKFGAKMGVGVGPTGQCYALPTLDRNFGQLAFYTLRKYISKFLIYVEDNPDKKFLLTKVGIGIAGYAVFDMRSILWECINNVCEQGRKPSNLIIPKEFDPSYKL